MSVTFRQGEGSNNQTRTITLVAAGGVVTYAGADYTSPVGRVFEITGNGTAANNSDGYTCVAENPAGAGGTITLRPAPAVGSNVGSLISKNLATARTLGAAAINTTTALPGGLALLDVPGANFRTNNIERNDRLVVTGSGTAANNGAWYVQEVLSDDLVAVRPPDGGAGMTTDAADTGSIAVRAGVHVVDFVSETTLGWQRFLDVGVPKNGPSGGTPFFGSGAARDYIRKDVLVGGRTLWTAFGISKMRFDQSALAVEATWVAENEIFVPVGSNDRSNLGDAVAFRLERVGTWSLGAGNGIDIRLGSQPGNSLSCDEGSVWIGVGSTTVGANTFFAQGVGAVDRVRLSLFGSFWDPLRPPGGGVVLSDGDVTGSIIRDGVRFGDGTIESPVVYGLFGLVADGTGSQNSVLLALTTTNAVANTAGAVFGGLKRSDVLSIPTLTNSSGGSVAILDPFQDDDLNAYTSCINIASFFERLYTFNPIFSQLVGTLPVPTAGLNVQVDNINENTLAEGMAFSGPTDASGRINGGLGTPMLRDVWDGVTHVPLSLRVTVNGLSKQTMRLHIAEVNERTIPSVGGVVVGGPPSVEVSVPIAQVATPGPVVAVVSAEAVAAVETAPLVVALQTTPTVHVEGTAVGVEVCSPASPAAAADASNVRYVEKTGIDQSIAAATTAIITFGGPDVGDGFLFPGADGAKTFYVLYSIVAGNSPAVLGETISVRVGTTGTATDTEVWRGGGIVPSVGTQHSTNTFMVRVPSPSSVDVVTILLTTAAGQTTIVRGVATAPAEARSTLLIWEE